MKVEVDKGREDLYWVVSAGAAMPMPLTEHECGGD